MKPCPHCGLHDGQHVGGCPGLRGYVDPKRGPCPHCGLFDGQHVGGCRGLRATIRTNGFTFTDHSNAGLGFIVCRRKNVWEKLKLGGALYDPCHCIGCDRIPLAL